MESECLYFFDGNRLIIKDPTLGIAYDAEFQPELISTDNRSLKSSWKLQEFFGEQPYCLEKRLLEHDIPQGEAKRYRKDGSLIQHFYYKNGFLHGPSRSLYAEGALAAETWFINGVQQGKALYFYPSSKLYAEKQFKDGVLHLEQLYYSEEGTVRAKLVYEHGSLQQQPAPNSELSRYWDESEIIKYLEEG